MSTLSTTNARQLTSSAVTSRKRAQGLEKHEHDYSPRIESIPLLTVYIRRTTTYRLFVAPLTPDSATYRHILLFIPDPCSCSIHHSYDETSQLFHAATLLRIRGRQADSDFLRPPARVAFFACSNTNVYGDGVSSARKTSSSARSAMGQHK